jgi:hypothetical protein
LNFFATPLNLAVKDIDPSASGDSESHSHFQSNPAEFFIKCPQPDIAQNR